MGVNWYAAGWNQGCGGSAPSPGPVFLTPSVVCTSSKEGYREEPISQRIPPSAFDKLLARLHARMRAHTHPRLERDRKIREKGKERIKSSQQARVPPDPRNPPTKHAHHPFLPSIHFIQLPFFSDLLCFPCESSIVPLPLSLIRLFLWPTITAAGRGTLETSKWYHGS